MLATSFAGLGVEIGQFLLPIVGTVLTIIISYLLKRLIDKMGIQRSEKIDDMIDKYVNIGITYANRAAEKKLGGLTYDSKDKLALAVKTVAEELKQSGIKDVAEQLIVARIESALSDKDEEKSNLGFTKPS